jgi:hypothetical protein
MLLLRTGEDLSVERILTALAVSALVAACSVVLQVSWEAFEESKPAAAQTTGTCPNAQLIDTFEGNGDQQTDTFSTTTDSFRVSYTSRGQGVLFVDVINADRPNDLPVADISQEGSGQGETFANAPPGTYYLDVNASVDYTITVEQCEGGNPSRGTGRGASTGGTTTGGSTTGAVAGGSTLDDRPGRNLFNAGGPKSGPLPLMPDGSCPKEFPVKRDGACFE